MVAKRFDMNTRLIALDGPPCAGKTLLGLQLAEEFDMLYVPHADLSMHYVNRWSLASYAFIRQQVVGLFH